MDSAGYTAKTLTDCGIDVKWISRVPETLKVSKLVIEKSLSIGKPWQKAMNMWL